MHKKGVLKSISNGLCPKCRSGKMFKHSAYAIRNADFVKMDDNCSVCNYRFSMEPGFFIGATYVNYAFFIVILLSTYFSGRIIFIKIDAITVFLVVLALP